MLLLSTKFIYLIRHLELDGVHLPQTYYLIQLSDVVTHISPFLRGSEKLQLATQRLIIRPQTVSSLVSVLFLVVLVNM